jgi:hypothetical protein
MAKRELPTPEELRQLLRYEPETGKLYWLERPLEMFRDEWLGKAWNTRWAGEEGLATPDSYGYLRGEIHGVSFFAHRVAWALTHGDWPIEQIDHINGQRDDNRIANLRCVSHAENQKNSALRKDNTTGRTGVHWHKKCGKWVAVIGVDGRPLHLGYFERFEDAVAAREKAEIEHGFHPNHGRLW